MVGSLSVATTAVSWAKVAVVDPGEVGRYAVYIAGIHFQHRNSRKLAIESLAHDSGRTLICAEYGYPKGSPNTNS
jgi:hypothetical protein